VPGLWSAGRAHGLVAAGYRAIESMRLEKGYRVWGTDITPETNPYEAGLGFCVKLDKPGGFEGREALVAAKESGVSRRLCCLTLADPHATALGSEPVRVGEDVVGRVTSGGYGYTVAASIAYAHLPVELAVPGTGVTVTLFGDRVPGVVAAGPLVDPKSTRVRADG
jgi:4-methylaminobutanoate oxidase (formaldehyde-forming)